MKTLKQKLTNKKGFTLMEMLIVVAIIVILVAISIPVFSAQLEKAQKSTDAANERAAKAAAVVMYLDGKSAADTDYYYNVDTGELQTTVPTGYGKCSTHSGGYIMVEIADDGEVTLTWAGTGVTATAHGMNVN